MKYFSNVGTENLLTQMAKRGERKKAGQRGGSGGKMYSY